MLLKKHFSDPVPAPVNQPNTHSASKRYYGSSKWINWRTVIPLIMLGAVVLGDTAEAKYCCESNVDGTCKTTCTQQDYYQLQKTLSPKTITESHTEFFYRSSSSTDKAQSKQVSFEETPKESTATHEHSSHSTQTQSFQYQQNISVNADMALQLQQAICKHLHGNNHPVCQYRPLQPDAWIPDSNSTVILMSRSYVCANQQCQVDPEAPLKAIRVKLTGKGDQESWLIDKSFGDNGIMSVDAESSHVLSSPPVNQHTTHQTQINVYINRSTHRIHLSRVSRNSSIDTLIFQTSHAFSLPGDVVSIDNDTLYMHENSSIIGYKYSASSLHIEAEASVHFEIQQGIASSGGYKFLTATTD